MKVGICLPMMSRIDRKGLIEWAQMAEQADFSSIAAGERIAWEGLDGLTALALTAGVTERIRLATSVLASPLHPTGLLAKRAATIDVLSNGRLTLGLGISSRPQDFAAAPAPWEGRARHFEEQLVQLKRIWAGESATPDTEPIGPPPIQPGGPEILVGAFVDRALERAGRLADGILTWSFAPDPAFHARALEISSQARKDAGRPGAPRLVAAIYFALGPNSESRLQQFLAHYYDYAGSERRDVMFKGITTFDSAGVKDVIKRYTDAGVDEILFSPAIESSDQVERLAEITA